MTCRLSALQKNGDEDWRKRIGKYDVMTEKQRPASVGKTSSVLARVAHKCDDLKEDDSPVQMRKKEVRVNIVRYSCLHSPDACVLQSHLRSTDRPSSIANRLSLLGNAQESWRNRVGEKDMSRFTVEGKMSSAGACCLASFRLRTEYSVCAKVNSTCRCCCCFQERLPALAK